MLIASLALTASFITAAVVNDVCGSYETVGDSYVESFSYCGAYAGVGGTRHCSMWLVGHERRVNTKVHGLIWDHDSYKVVDK